jgi:hypothetical protein
VEIKTSYILHLTTVTTIKIEIIVVRDNNIITERSIIGRGSEPGLHNGIIGEASTTLDTCI